MGSSGEGRRFATRHCPFGQRHDKVGRGTARNSGRVGTIGTSTGVGAIPFKFFFALVAMFVSIHLS
jgi:hypothetical protein